MMAPSWAKTTSVLYLLFLAVLVPLVLASPQQSLSADVDLVCHGDSKPADCYPRIFQPTEEFQIIHDDQDIPPGLHVRLNVYTGLKEARLNVPIQGEEGRDPAPEGLPVAEQGVVVVQPENRLVDGESRAGNDGGAHGRSNAETAKVPPGAPPYDPIGNLKPPAGGAEPQFTEALNLFRTLGYKPDEKSDKTHTVDGALEELRELSHDAYYGMLIAADKEVVKSLFCLMLHDEQHKSGRDQAAAYVLAGALSNNHNAVRELATGWDGLMETTCSGEGSPRLVSLLYSDFAAARGTHSSSAGSAKARIAALHGMLESPRIRAQFLSRGAMGSLLGVLSAAQAGGGREWEAAARRAGQLVLDRFLDEGMGAKLGEWPRVDMLGEEECKGEAGQQREGCWRYVAGEVMKGGGADWSRELWERLEEHEARGRTEL